MSSLQKIIREKLITISMVIMLILIVLSIAFTWVNKKRIIETTRIKEQAELVKARLGFIFREHLRGMDLGLRGYALTKNKQVLAPYENAVTGNTYNLRALDSLFKVQRLDTVLVKFAEIKDGIYSYIETTKSMKTAVENDMIADFVDLLNQDKGFALWKLFSPFNDSIIKYEDKIIVKAQADYEAALDGNIIIQLVLLALALPSVIFIIYRSAKEIKNREQLVVELEQNNKHYLFDPGTKEQGTVSLQDTIGQSINNFKKATSFINEITSDNFDVQWTGINDSNIKKNENTLAGELIKMRDKMKLVRKDDEQRYWANEGLAQFSQLIRAHQSNLPQLCDEVTRFLSRYLKVQYGILYSLNDEAASDHFLELSGHFATEKEPAKRIEIGNELIGQTFVNGEPTVLNNLPANFIQISSSLGDAKAAGVCIVPLKYNMKVEGVLEFASLHPFEQYQIDFLQKAGEFVAAAIISAKVSTKMEVLLRDTQERSSEMRAQEEELRQNMEELAATQEEMERQGLESKGMLQTVIGILNELPQKIFLKDQNGVMVLANSNVAKAHNLSVDELIGKSDFDFVDKKTAQEWRNQELEIVKKGRETYTFDENLHGETKTLTTTKMAFFIPHLKQTGLLGVQTDVTELEVLKKQIQQQ